MAGWDSIIGHSDGELSTVDWGNTASVARGSARAAIAVPCTLLYLPLVSFVLLYNKEIHSNIRFFFMDMVQKFHPPQEPAIVSRARRTMNMRAPLMPLFLI